LTRPCAFDTVTTMIVQPASLQQPWSWGGARRELEMTQKLRESLDPKENLSLAKAVQEAILAGVDQVRCRAVVGSAVLWGVQLVSRL